MLTIALLLLLAAVAANTFIYLAVLHPKAHAAKAQARRAEELETEARWRRRDAERVRVHADLVERLRAKGGGQ